MVIGVTGGIGSGKSTVCREFEKLGGVVIDADKISHSILMPGNNAYNEVVAEFGEDILLKSGGIDRKKLGRIVFSNKDKLRLLNDITHKYILSEMRDSIDKLKEMGIIILDVPLLFSDDFTIPYDYSVAVIADLPARVQRIMIRDGCSKDEALCRINSQMSDEEYRIRADFCIENNKEINDLEEQVKSIFDVV